MKFVLGKLQNIRGVATSFQSEVLALELDIPLIDLASVSQIDLAIDGADEVDPGFQLIKGGGACHVREKLVASKANQLLIVVDETKLVQNLKSIFPFTCRSSSKCLEASSGSDFRNEWQFFFKNGY